MAPRARPATVVAALVGSLATATVLVGVLENSLGVRDASIVYLAAVVVTAIVGGTPGAVVAAIAAFLLYDFLFTQPYFTLSITDPEEWVSVVLLLFVGVVVGQLAALQSSRAAIARAREREAISLFRVSRELATRDSTAAVLDTLVRILRDEAEMSRVWIVLGADAGARVVADTEAAESPLIPISHHVLRRTPDDAPAEWVRVHKPGARRARSGSNVDAFQVRIEAGDAVLGAIWSVRPRRDGPPDPTATRLLAAAADQLGQVLVHDRLAAEAQAAEIARQSDALKSALLQSVSHDLRTPLATIRAAAGTLRPGSGLTEADRGESADAIDREVEYLDRLVTNLLDLSRIEAGALRPDVEVFDPEDVVATCLARAAARTGTRPIDLDLRGGPVRADPIFLAEAVANAIENALKYTPPDARIRISSTALDDGTVRLTIEDAGQGVSADAMPHLFEKFYRAPGTPRTSRSGTGIGLAVVRGLVEASGGRVAARRSVLGGLAIDLDLPGAAVPDELAAAVS